MPATESTGLLSLESEVDGFLLRAPSPSSSQVSAFLRLYIAGAGRDAAARALIAKGVPAAVVANALAELNTIGSINWSKVYGVLSVVSMGLSAFHGYRRNQSIGWALWWALMGAAFPVVTPTIALAQGFGRRKG